MQPPPSAAGAPCATPSPRTRRNQLRRSSGGWLGSRVISELDSGAEGPGFKSQSRRCRVTVLGKLFTPIVPLFTKQQIGISPLKGCGGNCRPGGKECQPAAGFMTHVTCRLTAKNRDQLRIPTLGNRVWASFCGAIACARRRSDVTRCNCIDRYAARGPLCADMASSIKPEVHNMLRGHQKKIEPRNKQN